MEELGTSKAYAEFMQVFQRFDEQVAHKMDQAKKDTSMEALAPMGNQAGDGEGNDDQAAKANDEKSEAKKDAAAAKKAAEVRMTKKQRK